MNHSRLQRLATVGLASILVIAAASAAAGQEITVTLLGTGSPRVSPERSGPSILVEAGNQTFVFDAGRGALQRMGQIGVPFSQVTSLFLTHLHSDHVVGIPDLWLSGWLLSRRAVPLPVYGPPGTTAMMEHLKQAFEFDIRLRISDDKAPPAGAEVRSRDITAGVVYESAGVRVTAFEVDHRPIELAFGYRIDYGGRSVVLSGDTRFSTNLIKFAEGCDLLIHEVADGSDAYLAQTPSFGQVLAHHTRPEEVGRVFQSVKPKLAVYSHIVISGVTTQDVVTGTRRTYAGPLVVGDDLMTFVVGADVAVLRR